MQSCVDSFPPGASPEVQDLEKRHRLNLSQTPCGVALAQRRTSTHGFLQHQGAAGEQGCWGRSSKTFSSLPPWPSVVLLIQRSDLPPGGTEGPAHQRG